MVMLYLRPQATFLKSLIWVSCDLRGTVWDPGPGVRSLRQVLLLVPGTRH